jgi:MSHA biogenesis protein MshI
MWFRRRQADQDGWTSVVFSTGRVGVAQVLRNPGQRPRLLSWQSYARESDTRETLKRLRGARLLGRQRCTTLLRHGQYQLLPVEAPAVPREEMAQALRWQIRDMVDFPIEQAGIDVLPIPADTVPGRAPQVFVVAARREPLASLAQGFQDASVPLAAIDIPELAQRNVAALFESEHRALAMLSFDDVGGCLSFTYGGELYVTRHIDIPAGELAGATGNAAGGIYERVLLDVQRSLDNFDRNYHQFSLSGLMVMPVPGAAGFVDYLKGNLYQPVETADLCSVIDLGAVPALADPSRQAEAFQAIGAALRQESSPR